MAYVSIIFGIKLEPDDIIEMICDIKGDNYTYNDLVNFIEWKGKGNGDGVLTYDYVLDNLENIQKIGAYHLDKINVDDGHQTFILRLYEDCNTTHDDYSETEVTINEILELQNFVEKCLGEKRSLVITNFRF